MVSFISVFPLAAVDCILLPVVRSIQKVCLYRKRSEM